MLQCLLPFTQEDAEWGEVNCLKLQSQEVTKAGVKSMSRSPTLPPGHCLLLGHKDGHRLCSLSSQLAGNKGSQP